jgi:hypothetical protein
MGWVSAGQRLGDRSGGPNTLSHAGVEDAFSPSFYGGRVRAVIRLLIDGIDPLFSLHTTRTLKNLRDNYPLSFTSRFKPNTFPSPTSRLFRHIFTLTKQHCGAMWLVRGSSAPPHRTAHQLTTNANLRQFSSAAIASCSASGMTAGLSVTCRLCGAFQGPKCLI